MFEVVTRWGDTVLDIAYVVRDHAIGTHVVVRAGAIAGAAVGRVGLVDYAIRRVAPAPRTLPFASGEQRRPATWLAISLAVHLALWGVAMEHGDRDGTPVTSRRHESRPIRVHTFADAPGTLPHVDRDDDSLDDRESGQGAPMALAAGAAGIAADERADGHIQLGRTTDHPDLAQAHESAKRAGVLGSMMIGGDTFASVVGTGPLSSGFDDVHVNGPVMGGDGPAQGAFGLALGGDGSGACRHGECGGGIIGTGSYGTLSSGSAPGTGWGGSRPGASTGRGIGIGRRHEARVPTVVFCSPACARVDGELDKAIIRRYLRRAMSKITYCYEKELLANAEARASFSAEFLIRPDGHVQRAIAVGGDPAIGECVAAVIQAIEFPAAKTATQVHYPFNFLVAGS